MAKSQRLREEVCNITWDLETVERAELVALN